MKTKGDILTNFMLTSFKVLSNLCNQWKMPWSAMYSFPQHWTNSALFQICLGAMAFGHSIQFQRTFGSSRMSLSTQPHYRWRIYSIYTCKFKPIKYQGHENIYVKTDNSLTDLLTMKIYSIFFLSEHLSTLGNPALTWHVRWSKWIM